MQHPHHHHHSIQQLHSYRAQLIPADVAASDIEQLASANQLPTIRVRAADATRAHQSAAHVSGKTVFSVERVEG